MNQIVTVNQIVEIKDIRVNLSSYKTTMTPDGLFTSSRVEVMIGEQIYICTRTNRLINEKIQHTHEGTLSYWVINGKYIEPLRYTDYIVPFSLN